jgi:hypothetical protein
MSEELNENIEFQHSYVTVNFNFSPEEIARMEGLVRSMNAGYADLLDKTPAVVRSKWFYRRLAAKNYFRGLWNALRNKPMWDEEDDYGY